MRNLVRSAGFGALSTGFPPHRGQAHRRSEIGTIRPLALLSPVSRGKIEETDSGKTDYRNPAFPDSPRLGRKNCNVLILLLLFYGWSYDRASCINGKSGAELPSTPEGSCPPLNLMGCGILRKPRRLRHDLLEDEGYSDARGVPL
jgi:hypothetical protein